MSTAVIETMDHHHEDLLRVLDEIEALVAAATPPEALAAAIEEARRELLAHELTAEHFIVAPLRHLHLLDTGQLAVLADELNSLSREALLLTAGPIGVAAVTHFVRRVRAHIERKARAVVPAARSAVALGRLPATPRWCVEEDYERQGGPGAPPPEEWLG